MAELHRTSNSYHLNRRTKHCMPDHQSVSRPTAVSYNSCPLVPHPCNRLASTDQDMQLAQKPIGLHNTQHLVAGRCCGPHKARKCNSSRARQYQRPQLKEIDGAVRPGMCRASIKDLAAACSETSSSIDYFAADKRPVILFDGVCSMCNGGVNFVLDWDKAGVYRFAALQSKPGQQLLIRCGRRPDDISSIVLVEEDGCYIKSDAVLRIATKLGMPWPLLASLAFLTPNFVRDPVYDQVAANRYVVFGRRNSCRVTDDGFKERFLGN